jgi:hypothetical protein
MSESGKGASAAGAAGDPLGVNSEIGRKLKQYFDGVISEGVPDRFSQLLSQLERTQPAVPNSGKD